MAPIELVMIVIALAAVALAVIASLRVISAREPLLRTVAQLAFVWLVPIIGPLVAIQLHRRDPERHRPAETDDPGEVPGKIDQRPATFRSFRKERPDQDEAENADHG